MTTTELLKSFKDQSSRSTGSVPAIHWLSIKQAEYLDSLFARDFPEKIFRHLKLEVDGYSVSLGQRKRHGALAILFTKL